MSPLARARGFAAAQGLAHPLLQAPMAGVPSLALAAAVVRGGGMAGMGALLLAPEGIADWVARFRAAAGAAAPLQLNLWVPDPPPRRDAAHEARLAAFLAQHGPEVPAGAGDAVPLDFEAQLDAIVAARPAAMSTIMGLLSPVQAARLRAAGIAWWATVTTAAEARAALAAGADALVAQGAEAGGHRGAFDAARARDEAVGLFALLPAVADVARPTGTPVIAAGGIADARTAAAALLLGASAVQVGSALLRTPESGIAPAWQAALAAAAPEGTRLTRAFSGRWGRALATGYVAAAAAPEAPEPAPYPVQRGLTAAMRRAAEAADDLQHLQAWAGQGVALARPAPAAQWLPALWREAEALLGGDGSPAVSAAA
jgi:nitronate monooxygenase